ncbi:MAG: DUF2520 domain-containing protein [Ruminococcus sp.]|uniref:Rossmann-like and DUF2520 domain-containing protein n=1 Tax=Ruminococcus sp. TaxID=41978 RepID=UPI0025D39ACB|nr:Rossmann-like and DUF2520 domain-containing protein [Ruminococcus sp.]MCR5601046.1 DUF2520 domain-containing protein [Ruminococcus sp.]
MKIGFIGAGKVGFSLGRYFSENGIFLTGYYSRSIQSAMEAAKFTGSKGYEELSELVGDSDVLFITVSDGAIKEVYDRVKVLGIAGKQLCHCSGSISASEAFRDISSYGASCCSIHPLFPVSSKYDSFKELHKAFFCIEGNNDDVNVWSELFRKFGNRTRVISGENKIEYHAACAISSNLVCALAAKSLSLLEKCGFTESEAISAFEPLIMNNIKRILAVGPAEALTGPVERNDVETVLKHIRCMENDVDRNMYMAVSRKLVDIAENKHPDNDYSELKRLLK